MQTVIDYIVKNSNQHGYLLLCALAACMAIFCFLFRSIVFPRAAFGKIKLPNGKLNLSHKNLNNHALILAASSAGKTRSVIEPLVAQMFKEKTTGCLYDFKFPDVAAFTYSISLTDDSNIKDFYVNFHDASRSHRVNPHADIEDSAEAAELALTFISNLNPGQKQRDFWQKSATAILSSVIYFLSRHREGEFSTLPHATEFILKKSAKEIIDIISTDSEAAKLLAPVATGRDAMEQLSGQLSSIQSDLSFYANQNVYWALSENSSGFKGFELNNPEHPVRLVIGNNPQNPEYASPLVGLLFSAAFRKMMKQGRTKSQFLIDECGTYRIAGLESRIVTCRSYGISVCMALQDFSQLETMYGAKQAQAIRGSCNTKGFGRLSEGTDYIQKHFGTYEKKTQSTSQNRNGTNSSSGVSYSTQDVPRVKAELMAQLNPGEFIFDSNGKRFKQKIKLKNYDRYELPELTYVTPSMLQANYNRIEQEIKSITI